MVVRRGLLGVFAVLFVLAGCEEENTYVAPPPPKVTVAEPLQQDVTEYLEFTGTTAASAKVEVRARVSGILEEVLFTAGTSVSAGDPLFEIDPKEYEADLSAAEADLQAASAELSQAADELERSEKLLKKQAVAEVRVLEWKTKKAVAEANTRQANAALERARLNLGYTSIKAPIEGRVDRELVDEGNLVGEGEPTLLTTITEKSASPFHRFFLPPFALQNRTFRHPRLMGWVLQAAFRCSCKIVAVSAFKSFSKLRSKLSLMAMHSLN